MYSAIRRTLMLFIILVSLNRYSLNAAIDLNSSNGRQSTISTTSTKSTKSTIDLSAPAFLGEQTIKTYYDGAHDDLLTAGWTYKQLTQRKISESDKPTLANDSPDSAWLRKLAYFNNITALIDTTEAGGYGKLQGPKKSQKPISGFEYLSYSFDEEGEFDASLMLQIPDKMALDDACLIVAASSGSRGIYGAVGTVGSWALPHNCAVAYTDKGTGTGFYFFDEQGAYDLQGNYSIQSQQTKLKHPLIFSPKYNKAKAKFIQSYPHVIATKHAHSGKNKEKDFGLYTIQAAEFALYQLNQHFKKKSKNFTKDNTLIIAASISNGGASSLRAGELDHQGLFDAIVVSEPNISLQKNHLLEIIQGKLLEGNHSLVGYDYFIAINLFSPCTLLSPKAQKAPFALSTKMQQTALQSWCQNLKSDGFLESESIHDLVEEASQKINSLGIKDNHQTLAPLMSLIDLWPALATTYTNQLGRFLIEDNICGVYFSSLDQQGAATSLTDSSRQLLFATSNGIPPTGGIKLSTTVINQTAYERAKCFFEKAQSARVQMGVSELYASQNLNNIPTIIIHGRNDNLIAPNHSSRPYYAAVKSKRNQLKSAEPVRYYEVTNAQHFDAFVSLPQFTTEYIPLHYYFEKSLDLMMQYLRDDKTLPPSQVVKTEQRKLLKNAVEVLQVKHLPAISHQPEYPIILKQNQLLIPD